MGMPPPQAPLPGTSAVGERAAAVPFRMTILTKRADFLRASRAARVAAPGFVVQMRRRQDGESDGIRVGFTCSKKLGNAVARNRAKRRLREIARRVLPFDGEAGCDYVLVGRKGETAERPFDVLLDDLRQALAQLQRPGG